MYCSNCAAQIADGLNYCSRCGTPSERTLLPVSDPARRPLIIGASVIGAIGLMALLPLLRTLLLSRLETPAVVAIVLMYLITLILMFAVMMGMAWRFSASTAVKKKKSREPAADEYKAPAAFRGINTAQLEEPRDLGIGSVTESTTRTLDEIRIERKS